MYEKTYFKYFFLHVLRFLPALAKDTLEKMLDKNSVLRPSTASLEAAAAADIKVPSGQICMRVVPLERPFKGHQPL
jgi:hypothetical protein